MRLTRVISASRKLPDNYHNMPKRYTERHTQFISKRDPNLPQYLQKIYRYKKEGYYDQWRPWEDDFKKLNDVTVRIPKIYVEPKRDWSYFRGDRVEVMKGPEKGKQGIITYIVRERNWVFCQGLNLSREIKTISNDILETVVCKEQPFLIDTEVKLVDPGDLGPTDFEWRYDDDGERVRVSTRTERIIPIPVSAYETLDYRVKSEYRDQPKDTSANLVNEVTFEPEAKTFEMDICDQMGIKDDRVPYPMYWY